MLKLTVWDKDDGAALAVAKKVVLYLQRLQIEGKLQNLQLGGPFPALVAKVRDMYRFNVLIKAQNMEQVKQALLAGEFKELPQLFFDVDPASVV